jgi:membrane protein implicated in regulation of membrane protease activity
MPWIWLGLTVILIIIECLTSGLTTIWFAAGSFVMIFISLLKLPIWIQIIIFAAISLLLLIFTRPILVKKIAVKKTPMNAYSIIGKQAVVTKPITEMEKGTVKINGLVQRF